MRAELDIHNFQGVPEAHLVFDPGITVITGSTNSGKTALLRALYCTLTNPKTGKYFIGDSAKKAEVTLRLEGQPQVKWVRTSSGTQYHIGTETNEKCGKNDLWDFLPQYPIQKEPDGRIFNFHTEFDVLFPFGFSSQELFKIFERVVSLEDTASVLKSMNDELTFLTAQCDREYMWSKNARVLVEEENAALRSIAAATSTFSNTDATKTAELLLQEEVQRFRSLFENVDKLQDLSSSLTPLNDDLSSWFPVLKIIQINDQGVYRDGGLGEGGFSPEDRSGTPVDDARDATPSHANCTHACIEEGVVNVTHTAHTNSSTKETKPNQVRTTPQTRITATYLPYDARKHDNSLIETANALVERSAGVGTRMKMAEESLKALKDHTALSTRLTALSGLPECPTLDTEALERVQSLYGALERFRGLQRALEGLKSLPECPSLDYEILNSTCHLYAGLKKLITLRRDLDMLREIPKLPQELEETRFGEITSLLNLMEKTINIVKRKQEIQEKIQEQEEKLKEVNLMLEACESCPACGAPLEGGEYHAH